MKKRISLLILCLLILYACVPVYVESELKGSNYQSNQAIDKTSGYELLYYSEKYLSLAEVINKEVMEGDYESAYNLLEETAKVVGDISDLNVSSQYIKAKEHLCSGTWLDSFSYIMMLEGMDKKDYEETMYDGMEQIMLFFKEMKRLGHDVKF